MSGATDRGPVPTDLVQLVLLVAGVLEAQGIPYAVGGAVANNYWGAVRATQDLDVLVAIPAVKIPPFMDRLREQGFLLCSGEQLLPLEDAKAVEHLQRDHLLVLERRGIRLEVFTPALPLQDSVLARARPLPFAGGTIRVTSAEDLILLKTAFGREKDFRDIKGILWDQKDRLDMAYLRSWMNKMFAAAEKEKLEKCFAEYLRLG